ncbi:hypothetical protein PMAYCL1PPCAC_11321, partial [Pristionchus mayeri]
ADPPAKCSKCEKRKAKYTFKTCSHPMCDECFHGQPKETCGMYLIVSCHCGTSESFKKPPKVFKFNNND